MRQAILVSTWTGCTGRLASIFAFAMTRAMAIRQEDTVCTLYRQAAGDAAPQ